MHFDRARPIRLVVLDVDGVLTDGKITYTSAGDEIKSFNVKDGLGISLGIKNGLQFAIITARESVMVTRRAEELGIQHLIQKMKTKLPALQKLVAELDLTLEQVLYVGDDLPDIPCIEAVGFSACPADAAREVLAMAHFVSRYPGGHGAVREILELVLDSQCPVAEAEASFLTQ
ncbi:KdsC family phosphatase [Vampirovibrio sp.]|uniref:KdsC family phosphatase n=1 Tax=Vampirovibrio sp. TaxID=2717857 RepID=UPI0035933D3B